MLSGIITIVLMLLFVGIWIWAWRPRHKASFEATARLALEEDPEEGKSTADAGDSGESRA